MCVRKDASGTDVNTIDVVSDAVDIHKLDAQNFEEQIRRKFESGLEPDLAAKQLSRDWSTAQEDGIQDAWRSNALENEQAIGGLRNPHLSIKKLKGDPAAMEGVCALIDEHVSANFGELERPLEHLASRGHQRQ